MSSTSAKEFINDHRTLFRSSMKASRLKCLKFRVSIILGGGSFKRYSLQMAYVAEWSLKPTGITPKTYRSGRLVKNKSIKVFEFSVMRVKLSIICHRLNSFVMLIKHFVDPGLFDCFRSKFRSPVMTISFQPLLLTCFSSPQHKLLRYPHSVGGSRNRK